MDYDDRCEYQSEHDDGLADQELKQSESPVCAKGHAADVVFECLSCEQPFCEKHCTQCRECGHRACVNCVPLVFEYFKDVCSDCIEIAWQAGKSRGPEAA